MRLAVTGLAPGSYRGPLSGRMSQGGLRSPPGDAGPAGRASRSQSW